ncbi:MAG TPA: nodulation protein NfeD [bacterium]|jgi:membrane-bound serine protease (ClpP class)
MFNTLRTCFFLLLLSAGAAVATQVDWVTIDGAIGPVSYQMIHQGIADAEKDHAQALIIQLDTPGGLLSTTRLIAKDMLASKVPIVVFVAPPGARAGSAGVFVTLAANIAAMAPGTNIGAAHPVGIGGMGGSDTSSTMTEKVVNDAAAFARSLASQRHRNAEWAEKAVRQSVSVTDSEALALGMIDFVTTRDSLLLRLDGRTVELESGAVTLHTAGAQVREAPLTMRLKILALLSEPNIVYIFLLLGIYGLFFELYNPGAILPGVVGALSLIIAFYSLQLLPVNWAGLLLIFLGVLLFLLEIKIVSHGLLSVGGVVSLILGSLMLFDPARTGIRVDIGLIIPASLITAAFFIFVVGMGLKAQKSRVKTGKEGMIGEVGTVTVALTPRGKVQVHGEWWDAESNSDLQAGAHVRVTAVSGMTLKVEPVQ